MIKHFCRHITYLFTLKLRVPDYPGPATKINRRLCQTVVHWQAKTISFQAQFIAYRLRKSLTQSNTGILNGMVLINMQVAIRFDAQVYTTMTGNLVQHVVKEIQPCVDVRLTRPIQVNINTDLRLIGIAFMVDGTGTHLQHGVNIYPVNSLQSDITCQFFGPAQIFSSP